MEKRGGNQDLLAHALGVRVQTACAIRREIERLQYAGDPRLQRVFGHAMQAPRYFQKLLAGEAFEQDRCLWHIADPLFHIDSSFGQGKSRDGHASGRGSQDARDDLDSGGLAGAIGAEQADDLAPVESERYAMQDFRGVVAQDDLVERGYGSRRERILWSSYCSRDCRANVMAFDG